MAELKVMIFPIAHNDLELQPPTAVSVFRSTMLPPVLTEIACEGGAFGKVVGSSEVPFRETRMYDTCETDTPMSFQSITAMPQYQKNHLKK